MAYKDPEAARVYRKAWVTANPEKERAYRQKYAKNNRAKVNARWQRWAKNHPEKLRQKSAKRRAANPVKARAYTAAWAQRNPERIKANNQAWQAANPEKVRVNRARWAKKYPEKDRERVKKHHARKKGAPVVDLTLEQWRAIKEHYNHRCVYCGKKQIHLSQDHITPLSKGGSHTASNVVPACRLCNSKKGTGKVLTPIQPLLLI